MRRVVLAFCLVLPFDAVLPFDVVLPFDIVLPFGAAMPAMAGSWADTTDPAYAGSKAICRPLRTLKLPSLAPAERSAAACDSADLYYGLKHAADPAAARLCALNHLESATATQDDPFDGASLLTTLYANGKGAPRDLDIALGFACRLDGAPAEMDARVLHLNRLKGETKPGDDFDICDDATSGQLAGACESLAADRDDAKRELVLTALEAHLTEPQKVLLRRLHRAVSAYVAARGDNEIDMSGTARTLMVIGAQQEQQAAFMTLVQAAVAGTLPKPGTTFVAADRALNAAWGAVMRVKDPSSWGTVDKKGIRTTQIAWLFYRDTFAALVKALALEGGPDAIKAELTNQRLKQLGAFAP